MKKFNLFGLNFKFEIKRDRKDEVEVYSEENFLKARILYLFIAMMLISFSYKIPILLKSNNYTKGDIVISDIYAPKTIIYRDKEAKEKIIEDMIANSEKKYIYSSDIEEIYQTGMTKFFDEIILLKEKKINKFNYDMLEKQTSKKIPQEMVASVLDYSLSDILWLKEIMTGHLRKIYLEGVYKDKTRIRYPEYYENTVKKMEPLQKQIMDTFIEPNYVYDVEKTKGFIEEKVAQVKDQYVEIKAGTLIAKTGEVLTDRKINILENFGIYNYKTSISHIIFIILYFVIFTSMFYITGIYFYKKDILNKKWYKAVFLLTVSTFIIYRFTPSSMIYLIPLDTALFLLLFTTRMRYSGYIFFVMLGYLLPMLDFDIIYCITYSISVVLAGYLVKKVTTRSAVIAVGIELAVIKMLFYFLFSYFSKVESFQTAYIAMQILLSGLVSGMLTIAILPYFERTFNILTIFGLMELGDLSHPLLRKLSIEAPGTFQHSMMVAVLSENAVLALGGNSVFTRVACYYHDIGKSKRPKFYVENQGPNDVNPHNEISPFMSKLIITSHTKDGADMGKEYKIPKEIRDIMFEHQGTTLLAYFYNKAKEIDPNVNEEEFRYSGPKPQTKESAVIMLADSIEAAVESMDVKNPVTIEQMIRKIIHAKIDDNQLSDANITFKEIDIIIQSFVKTFGAIYHERIKYPGQQR